MITKTIIDLLSEEDINIPDKQPLETIDDTFVPKTRDKDDQAEFWLSTKKKLDILEWVSIDRQIRNFGSNKLDQLCLEIIGEDAKKYINNGDFVAFDFNSDSIPFHIKYNVAMAISACEAISILSNLDLCEVYASEEVKEVFKKNGKELKPGLNRVNFNALPLKMKKELVWPMVQNLYRGLTIRKAAQIFPEGVPGKFAYEALKAECGEKQLAPQISHLDSLKYSDYETIYFSDPSDLEIKYHVALYCLNHVSEIKPKQEKAQEPQEEKKTIEEEKSQDIMKTLEEEYISAFKRLNKNKNFWNKINLEDVLQMGKDVMEAIKDEIRNFAELKQGILYKLYGKSQVAIENQELIRIAYSKNPGFSFASQYLSLFFHPLDYYSILGLNPAKSITEKDVKDAFKKLAKVYHPDKNPNAPDKKAKELKFKLITEAKDALLKKLGSGKEASSISRDNLSLTNYLGNISKLFEEYASPAPKGDKNDTLYQDLKNELNTENGEIRQEERELTEDLYEEVPEMKSNEDQDTEKNKSYLGPYFEEMRLLESMIDGWDGKKILVLGAGHEPEDFSLPVILAQLGAKVTAIDVNYRGPSEYKNCQYYRASADRVDAMFPDEDFDIVISTAMFGAPFTNWAIRQYSLRPLDANFKDKIRELELDVLSRLLKLTKKGGIHFHYNRDLNPQSWNFDEEDLKQIGYESAFHPEDLLNSRGIWFIKK